MSPRQTVCVQGLGFVGTAMAVAVANARDASGAPCFDVVGVDLPTRHGQARVDATNAGILSLETEDTELIAAFDRAVEQGNLRASTDPSVYEQADVVIVDVHLDVAQEGVEPFVDFTGFRAAITTLGERLRPDALIIVETTVPPGTCERVVRPALDAALAARGLPAGAIGLAHSYERVMPGKDYYRSIVSFWRVFSGETEVSGAACRAFLGAVIDVANFPLVQLESTAASELAKVLENSYRATNIAFIEEWGRLAEAIGVDVFPVISAIRMRPTHSNIRQPGFGVGGYCLTKDPLLGLVSARQLFGREDLEFEFSRRAVAVNVAMPLVTVDRLEERLGTLRGQRILLLGVSYRPEVGDTRYSPSQVFVEAVEERGAEVVAHDPLVGYWEELGRDLPSALPSPQGFDAVVFAVAHSAYRVLELGEWLGAARPLVFDANAVLNEAQRAELAALGCPRGSIGRGGD